MATPATNGAPANAMAALEAANKPSMSFVPAKERVKSLQEQEQETSQPAEAAANNDEIAIDEDEE